MDKIFTLFLLTCAFCILADKQAPVYIDLGANESEEQFVERKLTEDVLRNFNQTQLQAYLLWRYCHNVALKRPSYARPSLDDQP